MFYWDATITGNRDRENEKWKQNKELVIKSLIGLGFKFGVFPVFFFSFPIPRFSNILVFCCRFTAKHRRLCKTIYGERQLWCWEAEPYCRWWASQTCRVSLAGRHHIYDELWAWRDLLWWFFDRPKVGSFSCSLLPKAGVIWHIGFAWRIWRKQPGGKWSNNRYKTGRSEERLSEENIDMTFVGNRPHNNNDNNNNYDINNNHNLDKIRIVNSTICSDIWHKYHEWYFEIDIRNLRQFWNITSDIYAEYHVQIMLLFVYTTTRKSFVIFTCRYFKLSWNTTALSQSNCRNFSCSSVKGITRYEAV